MATTKKKKVAKKQPVKDKGGRPTAFKTEYLAAMYKLCELGATDTDLSQAFGVTRRTICGWKKKHPEVFSQIKSGKNDANEKVKTALFNRALGFKCDDVKFATFEGKITASKAFKKHYPPDVNAAIFWLTNRDPDNWKRNMDDDGNKDDANTELAKALSTLAEKLPG